MNETIDGLVAQVSEDTEAIEEIVERWTGYDEALKNLRIDIEALSDYLTNL